MDTGSYSRKRSHLHQRGMLLIFLSMLVIGIMLTGCSMIGKGSYNAKTSKTGTRGLVIEFSKSNPKSVYEHEEFGTALKIKNDGSHDITDDNPGILSVGYDTYRLESRGGNYDEYRISPNSNNILEAPYVILMGKSQYYPIGEDSSATFYFTSNSLTELREGSKTEISYNLCYPYETVLSTMTCIDTKSVTNAEVAAACTAEKYSGSGGQGAPIAISSIEPEILLQNDYVRPQFKIYITNVGTGYVTSTGRCGEVNINNRETLGRVNVEAWLSGDRLECGPDNIGSLRLTEEGSFIRCSLPQQAAGFDKLKKNYITPLEVHLTYTYTQIEKAEIEIKRNDVLYYDRQKECNSYEKEYEGRCITKCEYCAKNPGSPDCDGEYLGRTFTVGNNFSCSCDLTTCNNKASKGNCIKGFCPGNTYCCSNSKCDVYQIEYAGECMDKCYYCSNINSTDYRVCAQNFNFTGFGCQVMTKAECQNSSRSCIQGYCGGNNIDRFCTNLIR